MNLVTRLMLESRVFGRGGYLYSSSRKDRFCSRIATSFCCFSRRSSRIILLVVRSKPSFYAIFICKVNESQSKSIRPATRFWFMRYSLTESCYLLPNLVKD